MFWLSVLKRVRTKIKRAKQDKDVIPNPLFTNSESDANYSGRKHTPNNHDQPSRQVDDALSHGIFLAKQGDLVDAEIILRHAETQQPNNQRVLSALGNIATLQHKFNEAERRYRAALKHYPSDPMLNANLGNTLRELGRYDEAIAHLDTALSAQPRLAMAYHNKALCLKSLGQPDAAIYYFRMGLSVDPALLACLRGIVEVLHDRRQYNAAATFLSDHISRFPHSAETHFLLGLSFYFQELFPESERALRTAVAIDPKHAEAWDTLGIVLQETGNAPAAIDLYTKSIELSPSAHAPRWHRAMAYLLCGQFQRGWVDYEYRPAFSIKTNPTQRDPPRWKNHNDPSTHLLILPEQGLGDQIMFASCIPDVSSMVERCALLCSPKLEPIFSRSFPNVEVSSTYDDASSLTHATAAIPIGSLPLYCRSSKESFPKRSHFLLADVSRIHYWQQQLMTLGTGKKIGISWVGGTELTRRSRRSIPLHEWLPIFQIPNTHFINLQYTECQTELASMRNMYGIEIHHWPSAISDYDETAALVCSLDAVISVQTALVHLSGALGQRTWALVSTRPEWRYGLHDSYIPWYSTVTILRQSVHNSWRTVIERMADSLANDL